MTDRGAYRQLHSARLKEYGQQSFPEVFGVDTAGTLAENEPSMGGRILSGACHLFKIISITRLHMLKVC